MSNSFIPYGRQDIDDKDIESVVKVLKSSFLTQGPMVEKFEEEVSNKVNSAYSLAFNSATSALHVACLALGLKAGDNLWTTPITFVASANCGIYCGAKIDFVDIDPKTGLICTKELTKKLELAKTKNKLPKIVIPVHLAGTSCEMEEIYKLSKKYGFAIIEDASHAIGGSYKNSPVGNCDYSDITVFSLHPVKIITSGEGGIATTNNKSLDEKMKYLRSHGITKEKENFHKKNEGQWYYEQQVLGYNYRMSDIHAALGSSQLTRLSLFIQTRKKIIEDYKNDTEKLPITFLEVPKGVESAYHLAIIRLDNRDDIFHRKIFDCLRSNNIGVQLHYTPVHLQPYYRNLGFTQGDFPEAESYSKNAISLPIYPSLSKKDYERVIDQLKYCLS